MSDRSGMGKSMYIQRLAEDLRRILRQQEVAHVTIPLHGPAVTPDTVLELFKDHFKRPTCCIYHIDIAPNVSAKIIVTQRQIQNSHKGEGFFSSIHFYLNHTHFSIVH